jgi:hypothetical protein
MKQDTFSTDSDEVARAFRDDVARCTDLIVFEPPEDEERAEAQAKPDRETPPAPVTPEPATAAAPTQQDQVIPPLL